MSCLFCLDACLRFSLGGPQFLRVNDLLADLGKSDMERENKEKKHGIWDMETEILKT